MSFLSDLTSFAQENVDEKSTPPYRVHVEYKDSGFVVTGKWMEETENAFGFDEDDDDVETYEHPMGYSVEVDAGSELESRLHNALGIFDDRVTLATEASVDSFSFSSLMEEDNFGRDDWPFYTGADADFRLFALVNVAWDGTPEEVLMEHVVNSLRELDPDVEESQIQTAEFVFSDMAVNELVGVSGEVVTPNPYRYYSDVSSLDEYIDVLADDEEEEAELRAKEEYKVFYRVDAPDEDPPEVIANDAEAVMESHQDELIDVEGDVMFEGEHIKYDDGVTNVSFWVRIPVTQEDVATI